MYYTVLWNTRLNYKLDRRLCQSLVSLLALIFLNNEIFDLFLVITRWLCLTCFYLPVVWSSAGLKWQMNQGVVLRRSLWRAERQKKKCLRRKAAQESWACPTWQAGAQPRSSSLSSCACWWSSPFRSSFPAPYGLNTCPPGTAPFLPPVTNVKNYSRNVHAFLIGF